MKRVMVNLDDSIGEKLEARAAAEKRSASNFLAVLVEKDLQAAGLITTDDAARLELLALVQEIGVPTALEALRKKLRTAKSAA